jgi:hypothetical protein
MVTDPCPRPLLSSLYRNPDDIVQSIQASCRDVTPGVVRQCETPSFMVPAIPTAINGEDLGYPVPRRRQPSLPPGDDDERYQCDDNNATTEATAVLLLRLLVLLELALAFPVTLLASVLLAFAVALSGFAFAVFPKCPVKSSI